MMPNSKDQSKIDLALTSCAVCFSLSLLLVLLSSDCLVSVAWKLIAEYPIIFCSNQTNL